MALGVEVLLCHQPDAVTGESLEQQGEGGEGVSGGAGALAPIPCPLLPSVTSCLTHTLVSPSPAGDFGIKTL